MKRLGSFTGGAVIGGRAFVNGVFAAARERFVPKRQNGARGPNMTVKPLPNHSAPHRRIHLRAGRFTAIDFTLGLFEFGGCVG
jgi:hypothetical protein